MMWSCSQMKPANVTAFYATSRVKHQGSQFSLAGFVGDQEKMAQGHDCV